MGIKEDLRTLACAYAKASEEAERVLLTGGNYVKALEVNSSTAEYCSPKAEILVQIQFGL